MTDASFVSWPMYAVDDKATSAFWQELRGAMRTAGLPTTPDDLSHPDNLMEHWSDPSLLLSQTCGFPYVTSLNHKVRYVCTPCFSAPGCDGADYSSFIVVRDEDDAQHICDLADRCAAYNSRDSHSGYNALRALVAPHSRNGRFFAATIETGSHRGSLAAVRMRRADVAAVDAVTFALVSAADPSEVFGLRIIGHTSTMPGLPLITSRNTSDGTLRRLRLACANACNPAHPAARSLMLNGIAILDGDAYEPISRMQACAYTFGYPELA